MAVLATDLHRRSHLAHDQAGAVAVLREVAVRALQALLGVDVHHMDGLARIGPRRDELALPFPAPALGIIGRDDATVGIQQIALAVALEHAPEIPAMAVVVRELGVAQRRVQVVDRAQEVDIGPVAARRSALGVPVQNLAHFLGGRIALPLRPHGRGVGLIVPHGVAEVAVHEHVRLVHVAVHALGRRDGAGEGVADRMARFLAADRRVHGRRLAVPAELRIAQAVPRLAVVGIDDVTGSAARRTIVARLVIGAHEPGVGVVQPGLVNVQDRHSDAQAGAGSTRRLTDVRTAGLFQPLDLAGRAGQADLGELGGDVAPAAFEHPEDVAGRGHLPCRDRIQHRQGTATGLVERHRSGRTARREQACSLSLRRIGLADDVVLVGQDSVVVRGPAEEHRPRGHQGSFCFFNQFHVAAATGLTGRPVITRIDEANELGGLPVQQGIGPLRSG